MNPECFLTPCLVSQLYMQGYFHIGHTHAWSIDVVIQLTEVRAALSVHDKGGAPQHPGPGCALQTLPSRSSAATRPCPRHSTIQPLHWLQPSKGTAGGLGWQQGHEETSGVPLLQNGTRRKQQCEHYVHCTTRSVSIMWHWQICVNLRHPLSATTKPLWWLRNQKPSSESSCLMNKK